jgi:hypothetical protein
VHFLDPDSQTSGPYSGSQDLIITQRRVPPNTIADMQAYWVSDPNIVGADAWATMRHPLSEGVLGGIAGVDLVINPDIHDASTVLGVPVDENADWRLIVNYPNSGGHYFRFCYRGYWYVRNA